MATTMVSPTSVATLHQAAALHVAAQTPLAISDLLAASAEELAKLCKKLGVSLPDDLSREVLFYHAVAALFEKKCLVDSSSQVPEREQSPGPALPAADSVDKSEQASSPGHHDMRILEAVEYTQRVDDGAHTAEWKDADLILLGVSRSGKTPLAMFLASKGYKVANFPLVQGLAIPDELFDFDQSRVVALVLDPDVLVAIRKKRAAQMGLNERSAAYVDIERIEEELQWVKHLYRQHPQWTMLDVTFRGIEEVAAKILKVMSQKHPDRFTCSLS